LLSVCDVGMGWMIWNVSGANMHVCGNGITEAVMREYCSVAISRLRCVGNTLFHRPRLVFERIFMLFKSLDLIMMQDINSLIQNIYMESYIAKIKIPCARNCHASRKQSPMYVCTFAKTLPEPRKYATQPHPIEQVLAYANTNKADETHITN
jgi:hypothetical protein